MSAIFKSIDEMLASAKDEHESCKKALLDRIFALETELTLHKSLTASASKDRDTWMRLATKLVTQFGTVEQVFSEAKAMALAMEHEKKEDPRDAITDQSSEGIQSPPNPEDERSATSGGLNA